MVEPHLVGSLQDIFEKVWVYLPRHSLHFTRRLRRWRGAQFVAGERIDEGHHLLG
jgi:hypothetical protein